MEIQQSQHKYQTDLVSSPLHTLFTTLQSCCAPLSLNFSRLFQLQAPRVWISPPSMLVQYTDCLYWAGVII